MAQSVSPDPNTDEGKAYSGTPTQQSKGGSIARDLMQAGKDVAAGAKNEKPDGSDLRVSPSSRGHGGDKDSMASRGARTAEALQGRGDVDKTTGQAGRVTQAALEASGTNKKKEDQGKAERVARKAGGKAARAGVDAFTGSDQLGQVADQAVQTIDPKKAAKKGAKATMATVGIGIALIVTPFILLLLIIGYVVTHPWDAVKKVITDSSFRRFALSAKDLAVGPGSSKESIAYITGAMPYETDYKPNTAIAAPNAAKPESGTLEEVISKIDYEKSRNKFKGSYCEYKVITKPVVSNDGQRRSVIDKIVNEKGKTVELSSPAVYQCVLEQYPVMEAMMRSEQARKINQQTQVNLSYAEKKDSKVFDGKTKEEIKETLHKKSLTRLWSNQDSPYGNSTECVKDFKPTGPKVDRAIKKVINDLACGKQPENIDVDYKVEEIPKSLDTDSTKYEKRLIEYTKAACVFYKKLNEDKTVVKKYQLNRAKSSARAGFQALTLADTGLAGDTPIEELNGDFYKISNFASSRAYNQEVNGASEGVQIDPEAIPTKVLGLTKNYFGDLQDQDKIKKSLFSMCSKQDKLDDGGFSSFSSFFSGLFGGDKSKSQQDIAQDIDNALTYLKRDIQKNNAQYYASAEKVTLEDIIVRTIKITSNASNSGVENGPDNFNRMVLGAKNSSYVYTMSLLGGTYQSEAEAAQASMQVEEFKRMRDKQNGIAYRLLNKDNPRSLMSRLAAETTATPKQVTEKATSYALNMLNPVKAFAELNSMIAYVGYGETNRAIAAADDDRSYWKIDTAGVQSTEDAIANARYIESLKKKIADPAFANDETIQAVAASFAAWDKCMETYYPDMDTLDESGDRSCQILRNSNGGRNIASAYSVSPTKYGLPSDRIKLAASLSPTTEKALARKYATYKGHMNFYGAWARLSKTEKDTEMYANSGPGGNTESAANAPQTDPGSDTSKTPCPQVAGISPVAADPSRDIDAKGVAQTFNPGKTPKTRITLCAVQGIVVNVSIATSLNDMINAAKKDGITLTGGGWRSYNEQKALRGTNGCPADDNASSSTCRVPTAPPGKSNHEQGEAIDFKNSSTRSTAVYQWLNNNASRFGLKNFPKEAWHWSRTGN